MVWPRLVRSRAASGMDSKLAFALVLAASSPRLCAASDAASNAEPNAATSAGALAEQRHREGEDAMTRGDFEQARLAFVQAYALEASPRHLVSLATAEARGTHPVEALAHFRQYLRLPSVTEAERSAASGWMAEAAARTGHIRVETAPGVAITLDSTVGVGLTPLADPIDVSPGPHRLSATRGAETASTTVDPRAGETVVWQLQWESAAETGGSAAGGGGSTSGGAPRPGAQPPNAANAPVVTFSEGALTPNGKPPPTTKWIVAASLVGAGLLSFGIAGGVAAGASSEASKESDLSAQTGVCPQPPMTAACAALKNAADAHATDGNIAIGFVVAGGVLAVAGVLALVAWPTPKPSSAGFVVPIVTPGGGGAEWIRQF